MKKQAFSLLSFLTSISCAVPLAAQETKETQETQETKETKGEVSPTWIAYEKAFKKQTSLPLPDYSHAGFALCPESVTAPDLPVLRVKDFGGLANDGQSDREAIQSAIKAGEAKGGAIIEFEAGRYLLNEKAGLNKGLTINGDNIVLRGNASESTELYMREHLLP